MESLLIVTLIFVVILTVLMTVVLFSLLSRRNKESDSMVLIDQRLNNLSKTMDIRLSDLPNFMQKQFSESSKIIKEVTAELTKIGEGQKQVVNLADQLKNLQDILKNPKQRGVLGEYFFLLCFDSSYFYLLNSYLWRF